MSKNLVEKFSIGLDKVREKKSVILKSISLWTEWNEKFESQRLSLMLKSPVIMITLLILVSVSLKYFKDNWDKFE